MSQNQVIFSFSLQSTLFSNPHHHQIKQVHFTRLGSHREIPRGPWTEVHAQHRRAHLQRQLRRGFYAQSPSSNRLPRESHGFRRSHTCTLQSAPPVISRLSSSRTASCWSACCVEMFITQCTSASCAPSSYQKPLSPRVPSTATPACGS